MTTERLSILAAAAALGEFTAPELAAYTGANPNTVRQVLHREQDKRGLFKRAELGQGPARRGRAVLWQLKDAGAVLAEIADEESKIAELSSSAGLDTNENITAPALEDRMSKLLAGAEDAAARAYEVSDPAEQKALAQIATNLLLAADPSVGKTGGGVRDSWWERNPEVGEGQLAWRTTLFRGLPAAAANSLFGSFGLHDELAHQQARRVAAFTYLASRRAEGLAIETEHLRPVCQAIAAGNESLPADITGGWVRRVVGASIDDSGRPPPVAVLTQQSQSPSDLFPVSRGKWQRIGVPPDLVGTQYVLWVEDWAEPLFAASLLPGVVMSHEDTPESNEVLNHVLSEGEQSGHARAMVVASTAENFGIVAKVSLRGGTFYPISQTREGLLQAVSRAVTQAVSGIYGSPADQTTANVVEVRRRAPVHSHRVSTSPQFARVLNFLMHLTDAYWPDEAPMAAEQAIDIYRRLIRAHQPEFMVDLDVLRNDPKKSFAERSGRHDDSAIAMSHRTRDSAVRQTSSTPEVTGEDRAGHLEAESEWPQWESDTGPAGTNPNMSITDPAARSQPPLAKKLSWQAVRGCYLNSKRQLPLVKEITDPTALGVHAATLARMPTYVERDIDAQLHERLTRKGFILLVGGSTAGKTRTALNALVTTVPDHVLIAPRKEANLVAILGQAREIPDCVLWLDNIEVFLRTDGLGPEYVNQFLDGEGHHRLIVATIREAEYKSRTIDENARAFSSYSLNTLLKAERINVSREFTPNERNNAAKSADGLIDHALRYAEDGRIPEFIAGAPVLLARWQEARIDSNSHERGAALVSAAVDCRRAGLIRPIPRKLIEEIHEAYLPADAVPPDSLSQAWEWATERREAAALVTPPDSEQAEPGDRDAVNVFDYLIDQPSNHRVLDRTLIAALNYANDTEAARIGRTAYSYGRYTIAYDAYELSIKMRVDRGAGAELGTLASRDNFARVLRSLGKLEEAEDEHRAVLKKRLERIDLAKHAPQTVPDLDALRNDTLTNRDNLGRVLRAQGKLDEAEQEHREVLRIRQEQGLTQDQPDFLISRMYLAQLASARGRHEDAANEFREILIRRTEILGGDNPDVLITRNYLADELRHLGMLDDAEKEYRKVIELRTQVLGADHPDTLISRSNLALTLSALGRIKEAADQYNTVLKLRTEVLGPDHPYTLESMKAAHPPDRAYGREEDPSSRNSGRPHDELDDDGWQT